MGQLDPFLDCLPIPRILKPFAIKSDGMHCYRLTMRSATTRFHSKLPEGMIWGYEGVYPGPTIETRRDCPVSVEFNNLLAGPYPFGADASAEVAGPHPGHGNPPNHPGGNGLVPSLLWTVPHLHGSPSPPNSDGWADDAIFPQQSVTYIYPHQPRAALLWYHDHANMITRLNVYAGLAGLYLTRDETEAELGLPTKPPHEIPLLIQDRNLEMKDGDFTGRLQYQSLDSHDSFNGDFIFVNGRIWPYVEVKARKYRLRLLNGSNARSYRLKLLRDDGSLSTAELLQIGTDAGFLPVPAHIDPQEGLTLSPAERADVILDLGSYAGKQVTLVNRDASGVMLLFRVGPKGRGKTISLPTSLPQISPLNLDPQQAVATRRIALIKDEQDMHSINGRRFHDTIEEMPVLNTLEIWEFINLTGDLHPMHLHLVDFAVLGREAFIDDLPDEAILKRFREWQALDPMQRPPLPRGLRLSGSPIPPAANERGPKDTVRCKPGEVTRIIAQFGPFAGKYMYHCHILEHEDMEMMRPFVVVPQGLPVMSMALPGSLTKPVERSPVT